MITMGAFSRMLTGIGIKRKDIYVCPFCQEDLKNCDLDLKCIICGSQKEVSSDAVRKQKEGQETEGR